LAPGDSRSRAGWLLPWEQIRWRAGRRLVLTDFRLVRLHRGRVADEVALDDLGPAGVEPSRLLQLTGIGTLVVETRRRSHASLRVPGVFRARRAALHLLLATADVRGLPPDDAIAALPLPSIWRIGGGTPLRAALVAPALLLLTGVVILAGLYSHQVPVAYAADDPVRPHGVKRGRADIVAFMESEVMPFAVRALEPVVGRGNVTCETCHGPDPDARDWAMPSVAALPEPAVSAMASTVGPDSQVRNALHGYAAEAENQPIAAHMRGVVLPGMAALLRRPSYDFGRSYEHNQERGAFGCYHCHMVASGGARAVEGS